MDWQKLLSSHRLGKSTGAPKDSFDPRTEFYRDWDRIIFSSAFRRLQDKTQVFPLAKSDYVRTRLTHSLEVASVGRSLGMHAADVILKNDSSLSAIVIPQDIGALVSTACLAHDIGNPPFGHAGESAIQEWFALTKLVQREHLTGEELQDLMKFEGNAQGLRSLCTLQYFPQPGGMRLTCAMLGTFTKYPRASVVEAPQTKGISGKKFGFMQSEKGQFEELADVLGLIPKPGKGLAWHRHPLAFLVEAADDICYHIMDVEDGFKAGVVSYEELENLHRPWVAEEKLKWAQESMPNTQRRAEYFRAVTVGEVMKEAVTAFATNYDGIMTGSFDDELAGQLARSSEFKAFKRLAAEKVYSSRPVVEVEACGFEVIGGLLDCFVDAIETGAAGKGIRATRARSVLGLLPGGQPAIKDISPYRRLLAATDFVAGMTDSYAVELYQRVRGISLP